MAGRMRLLSDRDSETTSIVLVVITPAPMVRPTPATSRPPTTEESTMVSPNGKRGSNEAAQSSATKRGQSQRGLPSPGVWVNMEVRVCLLSVRDFHTASIVRELDDRRFVFDPKAEAESFHFWVGAHAKPNEDQTFMFEQFLDETKDNVYVWENTTRGMLTMLLEGCNCSVFTCSSTGADKAIAFLGPEECPGVASHMASEFYQRVDKLRSEGQKCDVAVACLEVYKKVVEDLLCLDPAKGIAIFNLTIHKVKEAGTILELLFKGNKNWSQHATGTNAVSYWSHTIFENYVAVTETATSTKKETRIWMCSADLAGSEHAAAANRDTKDQMREAPSSTCRSWPSATASTPGRRTGRRKCGWIPRHRCSSSTMQESTVVPSDLKRRSNETAHSSAPKRRRSNKDQLSPGVRVHLAVRVRLLSYRDSATDSIVLVVITPAPMVKPTPATSRHPTTEESTMVSPNRKRHSNEAAQSSATKRRRSRKEPPSSEVRVNVRVNVRLLSVRDLQTPSIVRVLDYRCHVFDPKAEAESFHFEGGGNVKPNVDQTFMFYQFFDETEDHVYVFENTTWGMLTMLLEGCNCSVLACISRGTDKAFALLGSEECPGVLSLMASQLYQRVLKLRSEGQTCALAVPCLEVYNKVFQEMLCLDPAKGIAILNLTIHKVTEAGTILELFFKGNKNRSQHATDAHAESSSSHAIFESYVTVTENVTSTSKETPVSMCSVKDQMREVPSSTCRSWPSATASTPAQRTGPSRCRTRTSSSRTSSRTRWVARAMPM
ncbi:hypothetical protein HPB49_018436 [Dermacentor silvarum]|uniref:Uncharacterized protein n=1 Tax=Dermacentor silvarum TaxID=543639 RepID=A0ACB8E1V1_DERSI|nr:hypothetical protein HPB49_018436 [Dermacentor silvarum]